MNRFMALFVFLVSLVSCSSDDNGSLPPGTGTIGGRVSTAIGDTSVVGAIVTTSPPTDTVNTTGQGTYAIMGVPPGQYQVRADKIGYDPASSSVAVAGGRTSTVNILLSRGSELDLVPPAAVHDLVAHSATDSSITLSWTATGDDSLTGTAYQDVIYYAEDSLSVVTENCMVLWLLDVKLSGTPRSHTITGLSFDHLYFFGHRAFDELSNPSGLSNVVRARAFAPGPRRVWHVPGDAATIQLAADLAHIADTILVAPGVYTGSGNRDIDLRGKRLALIGAEGPSATIIDCQRAGRGINIRDGEGSGILVSGFTIRNGDVTSRPGSANDGGAIYGASFTLINCVLENNHGEMGGGMFCGGDSVRIKNCIFRGNVADDGGGLHTDSATPIIEDCIIENNTASIGGAGIDVSDGDITLRRCSILENIGEGAFSMSGQPAGHCNMEDCLVEGNTISSNSAAVHLGTMLGASLEGCVISGNSGYGLGWGGTHGSRFSLSHCTIVGNFSGIIFGWTDSTMMTELNNSIVAFSSEGSAVYGYYRPILTIRCCDFFGNSGGDWDAFPDDYGVNGNIAADPLFCDVGLADFRLRASSPCVSGVDGCERKGALDIGCR